MEESLQDADTLKTSQQSKETERMTDRNNRKLNEAIEKQIERWNGTPTGVILKKAYRGETSYEGICQMLGLDPEEYMEDD